MSNDYIKVVAPMNPLELQKDRINALESYMAESHKLLETLTSVAASQAVRLTIVSIMVQLLFWTVCGVVVAFFNTTVSFFPFGLAAYALYKLARICWIILTVKGTSK